MGLFVTEKNNFTIHANYVFDKEGKMHIIEDEDVVILGKTKEEKEKFPEQETTAGIAFNTPVNILDYTDKDVKKASFTFRRPKFQDLPYLMGSVNSTLGLNPAEVFSFNSDRINLLFEKGTAQDEKGHMVKLEHSNLGNISPSLGSFVAMKMNEYVKTF